MTDAPRTIHVHPLNDGGPCDGWDFEGWWHVDPNARGPGERYHHDAVVRELVESLEDIVDRAAKAKVHDAFVTIPVDHIRELAAALAKIAHETTT